MNRRKHFIDRLEKRTPLPLAVALAMAGGAAYIPALVIARKIALFVSNL